MKINNIEYKVAVLVPLYKDSLTLSERYSFQLTLSTLSRHDVYVICPVKLRKYISLLSKDIKIQFRVEYFHNKYFLGISGYNRLMTSIQLYKRFIHYKYILIVQTDSLVISDELNYWCDLGYSYIGAPWFIPNESNIKSLALHGVGNGGFSLRKVSDFIKVLEIYRYIPNILMDIQIGLFSIKKLLRIFKHYLIFSYNFYPLLPTVHEDVFWGLLVPKACPFFNVALPQVALSFAFEVNPEYMYELNHNKLPFGCHAWEKYDFVFWQSILKSHGIDLPSF